MIFENGGLVDDEEIDEMALNKGSRFFRTREEGREETFDHNCISQLYVYCFR